MGRWVWRLGLLGVSLVGAEPSAWATYSIAAVDPPRQQVGGAGTSCVGNLDVSVIYGAVPGVGVVHAQARLFEAGRDRAVRRLAEGRAPQQIIEELTQAGFDRDFASRQYGVVSLAGEVAAFTGAGNGVWAGHRTGAADGLVYSAQGNLLTGEAVVSRTADRFEAGGCDLAARLMGALEAGRQAGEGDARCTPRGVPSDSAFIRVQDAAGGTVLALSIVDTGDQDPVTLLRAQFDAWRVENPCPSAPDAGVLEDAGRPDVSVTDLGAPVPPDSGPDAEGAVDAGSAQDATLPADLGVSDLGASTRARVSGGCVCLGSAREGWGVAVLLLGLFWARRRGQYSPLGGRPSAMN